MQIACIIVGQTPMCVSDSWALEERLFTLNASAVKPQAHGNGAVNELECQWLRTPVKRGRGRKRARCLITFPLAILSRSSKSSVKSDTVEPAVASMVMLTCLNEPSLSELSDHSAVILSRMGGITHYSDG